MRRLEPRNIKQSSTRRVSNRPGQEREPSPLASCSPKVGSAAALLVLPHFSRPDVLSRNIDKIIRFN